MSRFRSPGRGSPFGRIRHGLLVLAFLFVLPMVVAVAGPAAADGAPDGCRTVNEDFSVSGSTPGSQSVVLGNGQDFLQCQEEQAGHNCREIGTTMDVILLEGEYFCSLNGEEFIACRDDIRFSMSGYGDPSRAVLSGDRVGAALVPLDAPAWWMAEVERESTTDRGLGCRLASNAPVYRLCEEIREVREDVREEVRGLEARQRAEREGTNNEGIDPGRLRAARDELHDLEHLGSIVPDPCWGRFPNAAYGLTYDARDDDLSDPSRLLFFLAQMVFGLVKLVLTMGLWLVNLALIFDAGQYRDTVADLARRIDQNFVHLGRARLSLFDLAWFALFAGAGFKALRGRFGPAGGEILVAVVLAGVAVVLMGSFFPSRDEGSFRASVDDEQNAYREGGYFDSVSELLNLSALGLIRVGVGEDLDVGRDDMAPGRVEELLAPFHEKIHLEFVERPYLFIQYGNDDLDSNVGIDGEFGELNCSQVKMALLMMHNPEGYWVQRFLEHHGCTEEAARNGAMSLQRLMDTALVALVGLILGSALFVAGGTLLVTKFVVAVLFVALPIAAVLAILPGGGRSLAWGWLTTLLQLWLAALATGAALAMMLLGIDTVLDTTQERDLAERWLIVLALLMAMAWVRRRLVAGARSVSRSLQQKLTGATAGPEGLRPSWGAMNGRAPMNDVDLFSVDRSMARASLSARLAGTMAAGAAFGTARNAARFTGRWTVGGLWRTQWARGARHRDAKWNQRHHWANGRAAAQVTAARNILQGKNLDRTAQLAKIAEDRDRGMHVQTYAGVLGRTAHDARGIDAAMAIRDTETLRAEMGRPLQQQLSRKAREAGLNLGFDAAQLDRWHTGKDIRLNRERLLLHAEHRRDGFIQAAGRQMTPPEQLAASRARRLQGDVAAHREGQGQRQRHAL
jgi:hypothetical protein